ncbi:mucin-5B-like [Haliotis rubra]|uniref:mucin-5B-like n=1 Tax=Haliotis rubra TaxID=36100 RepID=UPI001EE54879|nr:mucin-5B-like [Haliotis rubra]
MLPFWQDYEIGLITFQLVKNTSLFQTRWCSSTNDPYISTFTWRFFYLNDAGIYTLYKYEDNIEIQIQTEDCGTEVGDGPFCTCGVAVRTGRTVFEISHCESLTWHIGFTACGDSGEVMQVTRDWTSYTIRLPTGNTVRVDLQTYAPYFLNVQLTSSVNDVEKNRGMCGKISNTQNDDLIKRDGSVANSTEDFAESWRVTTQDNLFDPDVISGGLTSYKPLFQYCTCERETDPQNPQITCTAMAASETCVSPDRAEDIKPKDCIISKRKKRMAQHFVKRIKRVYYYIFYEY